MFISANLTGATHNFNQMLGTKPASPADVAFILKHVLNSNPQISNGHSGEEFLLGASSWSHSCPTQLFPGPTISTSFDVVPGSSLLKHGYSCVCCCMQCNPAFKATNNDLARQCSFLGLLCTICLTTLPDSVRSHLHKKGEETDQEDRGSESIMARCWFRLSAVHHLDSFYM